MPFSIMDRASGSPAGSSFRAWWRILHPLPSLLTVLAAGAFVLLAAHGVPHPGRLLYLLVVQAAMQFSISALNDYFDRHADAGRADKPVALGLIGARTAWAVGVGLALLAVGLSVPLGAWFATLTLVGLGGGLLYDAGLKYTALSWLPFAVAFPTLPLWAWAGVYPDRPIPPQMWWVLPVGAVLALAVHLADTMPDLKADALAGVHGLAHRLGLRRSLALCGLAFAAAALMTFALWPLLPYRTEWYLPGLALGSLPALAGVLLYRADRSRIRLMSVLVELGALALAVGWVGAVVP